MLDGLKDIVVSTVNSKDLMENAESVEGVYQRHVATFIPMGNMKELGRHLAQKVQSGKTVKGLLTAPYGYGKTSSLAFLWSSCQEQGLMAVPPFYCATWQDILEAAYGWIRFHLLTVQPGSAKHADELFHQYTRSTLEDMAGGYAEEHGISTKTAYNLLNDILERGSLSLELTPASLLLFFDEITQLVVEAGFEGLVLFPDEFQQYISKGSNLRHAIQEFREFIWGLATRSVPFGVVFSLPTYAESIVQEQGKDILHRLKENQLYYRLLDIYTNDFPEMLWQRYSDAFGLGASNEEIIGQVTLRSIGQIVEREDLGEGPRTVIECFKRAIVCYQSKGRSYTPLDLIDDFLETNIHFQAQANKLKTVTRQALGSNIIDSSDKRAAIKLLAAFPRGCPVDIQKSFGLYDVVNSLSRQAHGDFLTHLAEGYTLLGLQRGDAPVRTVDLIITEFWRGYEEDDLHLEAARQAFCDRLLTRVFQRRRGTSGTGWGDLQFVSSPAGSLVALSEGTFNTKFPRRRVRIQVGLLDEQLTSSGNEADIHFNILFMTDEYDYAGDIEQESERDVRFQLNLRRRFPLSNMPDDIRKLQDFMNPELVTPLLMLSLVDYFDRWEEIRETQIPESEKSEIEFFTDRLVNHCVQLLLSEAMAQTFDNPLQKVGYRIFEEVFNQICEQLYPNYHTFIMHAQYENITNDYINAIRDLNLKERRGRALISSTKDALSRRFGLGSVATFENRARSEYSHLMQIRDWKGRGEQGEAVIVLTLHPLEKEILERLQSSDPRPIDNEERRALPMNQIADFAGKLGYRQEEILLALQLLAARHYIRIDTERKLAYLIHSELYPEHVEERVAYMEELLSRIPPDLINEGVSGKFQKRLGRIGEALQRVASDDEEELDELNAVATDLSQDINAALRGQGDALRQSLSNHILECDRNLSVLKQTSVLDRDIRGQVAFVMHLNELRGLLARDREALVRQYESLEENLNKALAQKTEDVLADVLRLYDTVLSHQKKLERVEGLKDALQDRTQLLEHWIKLLNEADSLFAALEPLPDLSDRLTRDLVPEITSHFVRRREEKRDSLADWEPFKEKLDEINNELDLRRRHGNELFAQAKGDCEKFLQHSQIGDWRLLSRYTYGEDDESYHDLYREVCAKLETRLREIGEDVAAVNTDWLKAKYIHSLDEQDSSSLEAISEEIKKLQQQLADLDQTLAVELVKHRGEELQRFVEALNSVAEIADTSKSQLGRILFADHKLSDQETEILSSLHHRDEMDLTDLFVALYGKGEGVELPELVEILEGLYRKNRILMRVRRRG
jgi:hypothetical protein